MELALIGNGLVVESELAALPRAVIAASRVLVCLSLAQIGDLIAWQILRAG
jgi:hypothetical protein